MNNVEKLKRTYIIKKNNSFMPALATYIIAMGVVKLGDQINEKIDDGKNDSYVIAMNNPSMNTTVYSMQQYQSMIMSIQDIRL